MARQSGLGPRTVHVVAAAATRSSARHIIARESRGVDATPLMVPAQTSTTRQAVPSLARNVEYHMPPVFRYTLELQHCQGVVMNLSQEHDW